MAPYYLYAVVVVIAGALMGLAYLRFRRGVGRIAREFRRGPTLGLIRQTFMLPALATACATCGVCLIVGEATSATIPQMILLAAAAMSCGWVLVRMFRPIPVLWLPEWVGQPDELEPSSK